MTPYGNIRTAFLAALIRLADEIDVGIDRNSELLFDSSKVHDLKCIEAFATHESILHVEVEPDRIILHAKPKNEGCIPLVEELNEKVWRTLDYCRRTAEQRSDLRITQMRSEVKWL